MRSFFMERHYRAIRGERELPHRTDLTRPPHGPELGLPMRGTWVQTLMPTTNLP